MALRDDIEAIAAEFMTSKAKLGFADNGRQMTMAEAHMMACALSTAISMKRVALAAEDLVVLLTGHPAEAKLDLGELFTEEEDAALSADADFDREMKQEGL